MNDIVIRTAKPRDAAELMQIYKPYVENTAVSFEYETPDTDEFAARIENIIKKYPYIVAISDSEIVGYAYASAFKERKAYDWAVETTIYIKSGYTGNGIGKRLYLALEGMLKKQGITNLYACIAYTDKEDEYLTNGSMEFHENMGYRLVGKFSECGYKFGKWYDMVWMEKIIGGHKDNPSEVVPFSKMIEKEQL